MLAEGVISINGAILFVFILMGVVFVVIAFAVQNQKTKELESAYLAVARQHEGQIISGGLFGRPSVRFPHHGAQVLLDVFSTGGEHATYYTQLHLAWPDRELRFEVFPENLVGALGKLFGTQDIEIGSLAFDRDYIIRGNDERRIAELLTPPVQQCINTLRKFLGNDDIFVGAKAGTVLIKKRSIVSDTYNLERLISLSLELYDTLLAPGAEGIDFVADQESTFSLNVADTACQICGEPIKDAIVFCRSCKTPHHQECWVYYGKCSTYGCGETRYASRAH